MLSKLAADFQGPGEPREPNRVVDGTVAAMKLGCSGCLGGLVFLAVAALAVGGVVGAGTRMLAGPTDPLPITTAADGTRAQQKIFDIARRPRGGQVTLTEAEINALLARHLVEARGVRLS